MKRVEEMVSLNCRRALVVGGGGHIGATAVETLAELGAQVAVMDLPEALDGDLLRGVQASFPQQIQTLACDLRQSDATKFAVRQAVEALGGLEIIVHCAAYVGTTIEEGWTVAFEEQTPEAFAAALQVNLISAFTIAQEAHGALASSDKGSIILLGSIYGLVSPDFRIYEHTPMTNPVGYGCSKGGLVQLMRYLAATLAPDVRVNIISPGGIERGQSGDFTRRYHERTPLGRMATEEDLKGAIAYLASDMSSYVTGHNLVVDGGWTNW